MGGRKWRVQWVIRVLAVMGLGVAGYLTWTHLAESEPYCGAASSCADVQDSAYATVAGIPVAMIGLVGYLVLLALSFLQDRVDAEFVFYMPVLSFGAALIGVLYSAYLTYVEAFVLRTWCYWCVASALIITAIWLLSIWELQKAWVAQ